MLERDSEDPGSALQIRTHPLKKGISSEQGLKARSSGFISRDELITALSDPDLFMSYSNTWTKNTESLIRYFKDSGMGVLELSEAHLYNRFASFGAKYSYSSTTAKILKKSVLKPMEPLQLPSGIWIVHFWQDYRLPNYNNGSTYKFALFRTEDLAKDFSRTHKAVYLDGANLDVIKKRFQLKVDE